MKKFLLALILSVATLQPVSAQSYRGFADIEAGIMVYGDSKVSETSALIGVTTTHGVQLAEKFFIGAGTGILTDINGVVMPLYADFRFDFWNGKKASPFIDLKAGYTLGIANDGYYSVGNGLYLNPTFGFRIRLTERMGINIGLAYSFITVCDWYWYNYDENYGTNSGGNYIERCSAISIKAGIDF